MKKDKKEHKKGAETTIGKIIYGFLLFMPLFAIGGACLISTFNMSSKEETEITYKYETNEVYSIDDLIVGNIYHMNINCISNNDSTIRRIQFTDWYNFNYSSFVLQTNSNQYDINITPCLQKTGTGNWYFHAWKTNTNLIYFNVTNNTIEFDFIYKEETDFDIYINNISKCNNVPIEEVQTNNLDAQEVFYSAVDKVTESPLFSWAQNSIVYTTLNNTCNTLSITTPFIPLLMSYWLIISVIYFLYDIALMLIWLLHNKIHELQESF